MNKDTEWLKEEVNDYLDIEGVEDARMALKAVLDYIDQLDEPEVTLDKAFEKVAESYPMTKEEIWRHLERLVTHGGKVTYGEPEVLSQEWIDEHTYHEDEYDFYYADPNELKNLLVPKQEEQKVPKWFDEWCKGRVWGDKFHEGKRFTRSDVRALVQIADGERLHGLTQEQSDEISRDFFKYLDAFHYGYEVEEEQKYRVLDGNTTLLGRINGLMLTTVEILEYYPEYAPTFDLTEQEIKDYDERYFAFAVPVEELEE